MVHGAPGHGPVGEFVSYLDLTTAMFDAPKKASVAELRLAPGDAALDVGCGLGDDVRRIADAVGPTGRAVGIDASAELLEVAATRTATGSPVELVHGDAHALPFEADEFAAARIERVLQHADDPGRIVAEIARVVRPGGRVVAMEPDWDAVVIGSADLATARAAVRACADRIPHPDAGRRLPEWFTSAGIEVLRVDAETTPIRSLDVAAHALDLHAALETLGVAVARPWLEELRRRDAAGAFLAAAAGFGAVGRVC